MQCIYQSFFDLAYTNNYWTTGATMDKGAQQKIWFGGPQSEPSPQ